VCKADPVYSVINKTCIVLTGKLQTSSTRL